MGNCGTNPKQQDLLIVAKGESQDYLHDEGDEILNTGGTDTSTITRGEEPDQLQSVDNLSSVAGNVITHECPTGIPNAEEVSPSQERKQEGTDEGYRDRGPPGEPRNLRTQKDNQEGRQHLCIGGTLPSTRKDTEVREEGRCPIEEEGRRKGSSQSRDDIGSVTILGCGGREEGVHIVP